MRNAVELECMPYKDTGTYVLHKMEDTIQLICTFWVEFVCKPDALVAPVGVGGISAVALLSLLFGLANAVFKVVEGWHEAWTGQLHSLDASSLSLV